jgi:hypothetical protein
MLPTPIMHDPDTVRVYVSFCDERMVGRPGYVDLCAHDITRVLRVCPDPLLDVGVPGSFDDNGVVALSIVPVEPRVLYMYYVGFELGMKIRYRLFTGLAISKDEGETFERISRAPILDRSSDELFFRCGPHVFRENGRFRMWYVAGSEWTRIGDKDMPVYDLRYAESADGIHWPAYGEQCMAVTDPDEHGFGRPWIVHDERGYRMYYSVRRRSLAAYRLGYAESADGLRWERQDDRLGLDVSASGWDSHAIMYSAILNVGERTYAFYNGNEFGRDGFGVAVLEQR